MNDISRPPMRDPLEETAKEILNVDKTNRNFKTWLYADATVSTAMSFLPSWYIVTHTISPGAILAAFIPPALHVVSHIVRSYEDKEGSIYGRRYPATDIEYAKFVADHAFDEKKPTAAGFAMGGSANGLIKNGIGATAVPLYFLTGIIINTFCVWGKGIKDYYAMKTNQNASPHDGASEDDPYPFVRSAIQFGERNHDRLVMRPIDRYIAYRDDYLAIPAVAERLRRSRDRQKMWDIGLG